MTDETSPEEWFAWRIRDWATKRMPDSMDEWKSSMNAIRWVEELYPKATGPDGKVTACKAV